MAKLSYSDRKNLPDSAFAIVFTDSNGNKIRKLPYKFADGSIDKNHLRNALARISQVKDVPASILAAAKRKLINAARKVGIKVADDKAFSFRELMEILTKSSKNKNVIKEFVLNSWDYINRNKDKLKYYNETKSQIVDYANEHNIDLPRMVNMNIIKSMDEELKFGVIYGSASVAEIFDSDQDYISIDELKKAAHYFMSHRKGDIDHDWETHGEIVESLILDKEMQEAIVKGYVNPDDPDGIKVNSWIIGWKASDIEIAKRAREGEFVGFSWGGLANRELIEDED